jgi:hypothetical protein
MTFCFISLGGHLLCSKKHLLRGDFLQMSGKKSYVKQRWQQASVARQREGMPSPREQVGLTDETCHPLASFLWSAGRRAQGLQ